MANETCGWLIKHRDGTESPCALKPGHSLKSVHRNAEAAERDRQSRRDYYEANREKIAVQQRAYTEVNKEKLKSAQQRWYVANREWVAERGREYRTANQELIKSRAKKYREIHPDQHREWYAANRERELRKRRAETNLSCDGFSYVMVSRFRPGVVKIGSAINLNKNLSGARRYLPDAQFVRIYPGGQWLEFRYLHRVFAKLVEPTDKIRHEWFAVPPEAVDLAVLLLQILLQYPAFLVSKEPL